MGTHPIFESDFDCLTDMIRCLFRKSPKGVRYSSQKSSAFESSVDSKITAKYQNRGLSEQEIRKKVVAEATKSRDIHSKIAGDEYQKGSAGSLSSASVSFDTSSKENLDRESKRDK